MSSPHPAREKKKKSTSRKEQEGAAAGQKLPNAVAGGEGSVHLPKKKGGVAFAPEGMIFGKRGISGKLCVPCKKNLWRTGFARRGGFFLERAPWRISDRTMRERNVRRVGPENLRVAEGGPSEA